MMLSPKTERAVPENVHTPPPPTPQKGSDFHGGGALQDQQI